METIIGTAGNVQEHPGVQAGECSAESSVTGPYLAAVLSHAARLPVERSVCVPTLGVAPGATLAQPVRRGDQVVLLPAGSVIDADQVRRLIQRGIDFVYILQMETRDPDQVACDIAAATARVAHLFRGESNPTRDCLANVIGSYRRQAAS